MVNSGYLMQDMMMLIPRNEELRFCQIEVGFIFLMSVQVELYYNKIQYVIIEEGKKVIARLITMSC